MPDCVPTPLQNIPPQPRESAGQSCADCGERARARLPFTLRTAFQPIVDVTDGSVFAQEALVRGPQGEGAGWVLAQVDDGLRYAFDQACRVTAIAEATRLGIEAPATKLSINFLPNAIYQPENCLRLTLRAAERAGLPLSALMFEVTEAEQVRDPARLRCIVSAYRRHGFTIAIDDFGAGYAGLGLLAEFRPDVVKLDMKLVRGLDADAGRRAILRGTLSICAELGIRVVAEGVETMGEFAALSDLGVRLFQGYLLARPALGRLPVPVLPDD